MGAGDERARATHTPAILLGVLIALVCARSWVPLRYYVHFDSDQALFGLMARDLVARRGFPVFMYGQRYMLAVSVWLCAPLFMLFGSTITMLKLPLFLMNVAVVVMLWIGLRREPGTGPWGTAVAILPFAMPTAAIGVKLLEHSGGNIEPFVFVLAMFLLRARPLALGVVLGFAFLNREFALIGFFALALMDAVQGRLKTNIARYALTIAVAAAVVIAVRVLAHWSTGYGGTLTLYRRPDWNTIAGFWAQQLPSLIGGAPRRLLDFNIVSSLTVGHPVVYVAVIVWLVSVVVMFAFVQPPAPGELDGMAMYLTLVGLGQAAAFHLLSPYPRDIMAVRYVLLTLLAIGGLTALAWRRPVLRVITAGVIIVLFSFNLTGTIRLLDEYVATPMPRPLNQLADALLQRGVRYARADYWIAYDVAWVTGERVIASPPRGFDRVKRYSDILDANSGEVFSIALTPQRGCEPVVRWYLCPP